MLGNGAQNLPAKRHCQFSRRGLNRLCCLAGKFYAPFFRISCKTFLESLKRTCSLCNGLIYWCNNFIKILLRPLWTSYFSRMIEIPTSRLVGITLNYQFFLFCHYFLSYINFVQIHFLYTSLIMKICQVVHSGLRRISMKLLRQ